MGLGDNLMASGMARGARTRGRRVAFGDGKKIIWDHHSEQIFRNNPNIAFPGSEREGDLDWIPFYRGNRIYNKQASNRWIWNYSFKATPGEIFLSDDEKTFARWASGGPKAIIIEPNVPEFKTVAINKAWPLERYRLLAARLVDAGYRVAQFANTGKNVLARAHQMRSPTFRHALAIMQGAALYIGPEGGLHHGAACVGIPGVVLFGGFIPPAITGYPSHTNLTGGAEACGSLSRCLHCVEAMKKISVDEVFDAAIKQLEKQK